MSVLLRRSWSLALVLVGLAALVGSWTLVVRTLREARPIPSSIRPSAIVWGDRTFADVQSFRRWLRERGASYERWARLHPDKAAVLEHRSLPARGQRGPTAPRAALPQRAHRPPPAAVSLRGGGSIVRSVVVALLLGFATVLLACALLPAPFRRRYPRLTERIWPYRGALGVAGAAIVLGVAIGSVLD